jgi:hypothetical protein
VFLALFGVWYLNDGHFWADALFEGMHKVSISCQRRNFSIFQDMICFQNPALDFSFRATKMAEEAPVRQVRSPALSSEAGIPSLQNLLLIFSCDTFYLVRETIYNTAKKNIISIAHHLAIYPA